MIVYIDMDDVLCDFIGEFEKQITLNPGIKFPQSQFGFFVNLSPIKDAIKTVKALISSERYDPYILTAPSEKNPMSYTEKRVWVERWFGLNFVSKLIISPNKGLLRGKYLIDDNIAGKGQENFEGELIQFGSERYPDWKSVGDYLTL